MNTKQIFSALKTHPSTKQQFVGVFPCDRLPDKVPWPSALVVNTDPHNKPGQHWIAIYIDQYGNANYFDSYGKCIGNVLIANFIAKNSKTCSENCEQLQTPLSSVCGQYCIYFVLLRCLGRPMYFIVKLFKDRLLNDSFITAFINRCFNLNLDTFEDDIVVNQLCSVFSA